MSGVTGELLGSRYLLLKPADQAGRGQVWRARDQVSGREVTVTEVLLAPESPAERAALLARLTREAQVAAGLSHQGVMPVLDVVDHQGTPWLVLPLVSGTSLAAEAGRLGPLPWPRVARIGQQVADALAYAHAAGLVHGGLQPDSIVLAGPDGDQAVVTGFGLTPASGAAPALTGSGPGTDALSYLAPEQLEDGPVGPPADLWALGAILYRAVEGRPPFTGPTPASVAAGILARSPAPPGQAGALGHLIGALLSKDPVRRPRARTTATALTDINALTGNAPAGNAPAGTQPGAWFPPGRAGAAPRRPPRLRSLLIVAAAIAATAVLVLATVLFLPARKGPRPAVAGESVPTSVPAFPSAFSVPAVPSVPAGQRWSADGPLPTGTQLGTLSSPTGDEVQDIAFSPDGKSVAGSFSSVDDNDNFSDSIGVWSTASLGRTSVVRQPDSFGLSGISFSPVSVGGLGVAGGSGVFLGNPGISGLKETSDPYDGDIGDVVYAADGKTIVVGDINGDVFLGKVSSANVLRGGWSQNITNPVVLNLVGSDAENLEQVAVSPNGRYLALSDIAGNAYVQNRSDGSVTAVKNLGIDGYHALAFSPDGKTLAIAGSNQVLLLNLVTRTFSAPLELSGVNPAAVAYVPGRDFLAVAGPGGIGLYNLASGQVATVSSPALNWNNLVVSPDGATLAVSDTSKTKIYLYRITYPAS